MVGGGASIAPSALGTWCPKGLVVPLGIGSKGKQCVLSDILHGIESVSAVSLHEVQNDRMQNSLDSLSPQSQTSGDPTQGSSHSVKATIFTVKLANTPLCGRSAAAD